MVNASANLRSGERDWLKRVGHISLIRPMNEPVLSPEETATLIDYARRKYAEERYPLSPELREVREALLKLRPKPAAPPRAPARPYVPSSVMQKKRRR